MKSLKEVELPGYDVSVSFEGPKTLSVLKQKKGVGPQNGAILVASNNRKEENEVKLHSRRDAHKGKHSRRDAHKGNFENYDWIGVDQPKHAIGDEIEAATKDEEPRYSNPTDGGCEAEAGVDYKRKYDITGCMDVDPDEHDEEEENVLEKWMEFKELFLLDEMIKDYSETDIQRLQNQPIRIFRGIKFMSESRQISREATRKFILLSHVYKRAGIHTLVEFHFVSSVWPTREEHSGKLISYKTFTWKKFPKGLSL
ncbi:hypothetical protein HPP92_028118 [Vanilla planifolia]|uniref:Uncharacterized protein n=1 Tax=Vanilla planifolia TaxID=51239 RepID=A0A835U372_VANPL|nr:hypothetical protein HPP92_028118 [Vanilla planifolia]